MIIISRDEEIIEKAIIGGGHEEWRPRDYLSDEKHVIHTAVTKFEWDNEGDVKRTDDAVS